MSLLSIDITQPKILPLWGDIPAPQPAEEPPTQEEIAYSIIVAINPLIEELQPVSIYTGKPIRKVKLPQDIINRINKINTVI